VHKHASARAVRITFRVRSGLARLEVSDDGTGFAPGVARDGAGGYGLRGMAERAELVGGRLAVRTRPGLGTTVAVAVPATARPGP
jgi:signal transduction histidine kinase